MNCNSTGVYFHPSTGKKKSYFRLTNVLVGTISCWFWCYHGMSSTPPIPPPQKKKIQAKISKILMNLGFNVQPFCRPNLIAFLSHFRIWQQAESCILSVSQFHNRVKYARTVFPALLHWLITGSGWYPSWELHIIHHWSFQSHVRACFLLNKRKCK